jgi:hypothetical protein
LFDRPKPTAGCSANGEEEEDYPRRGINNKITASDLPIIYLIDKGSTVLNRPVVIISVAVGPMCVSVYFSVFRKRML